MRGFDDFLRRIALHVGTVQQREPVSIETFVESDQRTLESRNGISRLETPSAQSRIASFLQESAVLVVRFAGRIGEGFPIASFVSFLK
jgi:hypothetical protein